MTPTTVHAGLRALLDADPSRPLITYLGAGGQRTELSARTFENNVAKAANLLRDDADVSARSRVALLLPPHWQAAVWLGACAATGCSAWIDGDPRGDDAEVSVVSPDRLEAPRAPLALATSLHPFGMPFGSALPGGLLDASVEVRAHGDVFVPYADVPGGSAWLVLGDKIWTQQEALADAAALADRVGLPHGGRLLCAVPPGEAQVDTWLAVLALPLSVAGSVVLLADEDADVRATADRERCDAVLR